MVISSFNTDTMRPFFLSENGVRPWEGADKDPLIGQFSTLTIVGPSVASIVEILKIVFLYADGIFQNFVRWHTTGASLEGGLLQKEKIKRRLKVSPPGFHDLEMGIDPENQVLFTGSFMKQPISISHVESLLSYRYTILISSAVQRISLHEVFPQMKSALNGMNEETIHSIVEKNPDWVFCRCYEQENQCTWQFLGKKETIDKVEAILNELKFEQVKNKSEAAKRISKYFA